MLYLLFGQMGLVNNIRTAFGLARYSFFLEADAFRPLYIFSGNWQDFGWSAIIYLAALSGVDPALHEAAEIDGASRLRRVFAVDIPAIMPTISVMSNDPANVYVVLSARSMCAGRVRQCAPHARVCRRH